MDNQTYKQHIAELQIKYFGQTVTPDDLKQTNKEQEKKLTKARSRQYEFVEHLNDKYKKDFQENERIRRFGKNNERPKTKEEFFEPKDLKRYTKLDTQYEKLGNERIAYLKNYKKYEKEKTILFNKNQEYTKKERNRKRLQKIEEKTFESELLKLKKKYDIENFNEDDIQLMDERRYQIITEMRRKKIN